jgi:hypothetical protein
LKISYKFQKSYTSNIKMSGFCTTCGLHINENGQKMCCKLARFITPYTTISNSNVRYAEGMVESLKPMIATGPMEPMEPMEPSYNPVSPFATEPSYNPVSPFATEPSYNPVSP